MNGFLDESNDAFLTFDFGQGELEFLVDTGSSGSLVVGEYYFDASKASFVGHVEVGLAAGQTQEYARYEMTFTWFARPINKRILVGPGKECIVGTELFNPNRLEIDYSKRTVRLTPSSN